MLGSPIYQQKQEEPRKPRTQKQKQLRSKKKTTETRSRNTTEAARSLGPQNPKAEKKFANPDTSLPPLGPILSCIALEGR
ncbi:hypothetical protein P153DRAFT_182869 [Dothidotthia symphoricarpi CBS 119687]|uniref:Uncharacterized protein n=1 Tax=Dothidotthia symphoricarpi CBS 119687 TaxID=1392245 RepID=A0A6A6AJL9_9PLEO|nr:uncharacterized protein P153DRAFT_182869 [Dothidotthia symphoricarpi CBS 119687]KAF2132000.1 hypothetical protein P153DRAFT_182869 [Dothidotthia symphoricarpi CBS 119687]